MKSILSVLTIAALLFAGCTAGDSVTISGSGATFPKPLIEQWSNDYHAKNPNVKISYGGGGSGKGITDITDKNVVFAGSDLPLSPSDRAKAPNILHIPETLGLVAVVYNVEGVGSGLKLDGATVGKIYTGEIRKWNDPDIQALNPGLSLPDKNVAVAGRADSSGTTFVFTDWLVKTSPAWVAKMGAAPNKKPNWAGSSANTIFDNGNDGVASKVKSTPNSIGYVEFAYVGATGLKAASIKNANGKMADPSIQGAKDAAMGVSLPKADADWSKVSITNAAGDTAYPISSFSYILVYKSVNDYGGKVTADQLKAFKDWMAWCLREGQSRGPELGYAELPPSVVQVAEEGLAMIQV